MRERQLKKVIQLHFATGDLEAVMAMIDQYPGRKLLNPLISLFCSTDEMIKWQAITAVGSVVGALADDDMEDGRVVMRRFMWMLNDESGGIGWGAPEAMGEVMAVHEGLANEYAHILIANMREEGNFLELEMLQRGLMWGLGRLCGARRELMLEKNAQLYLLPYLDSRDAEVRGRAAWALGRLRATEAAGKLSGLQDDQAQVTIYQERELRKFTVAMLAGKALAGIRGG